MTIVCVCVCVCECVMCVWCVWNVCVCVYECVLMCDDSVVMIMCINTNMCVTCDVKMKYYYY